MVKINTDESTKFALLIRLKIVILHPKYIVEDMKTMKNNIIGYSKGLQKKLIKLASQFSKDDSDQYIIFYKEFHN